MAITKREFNTEHCCQITVSQQNNIKSILLLYYIENRTRSGLQNKLFDKIDIMV